jgi:hypothetical protein
MIAAADATVRELEHAAHVGDVERVLACLSADIVVRSPITQRIRFVGIDQATELFHRVFAIVEDITFYETVGAGECTQVVFWQGRIRGHLLEEANLLRIDDSGQIAEMTVFMRPIPGLLTFAVAIASSLAARRGRLRALAVRGMLGSVAAVFRSGESTVLSLTGAGVRVSDAPVPDG